jgi:hypothetical protein
LREDVKRYVPETARGKSGGAYEVSSFDLNLLNLLLKHGVSFCLVGLVSDNETAFFHTKI